MAKKYENIENISKLISGGSLAELNKKISSAERSASDILKKLNDMEAAIKQKKFEEEQAAAREAAEALRAQEEKEVQTEKTVEEKTVPVAIEEVPEKPA